MNLLQGLKPVNQEDDAEWEEWVGEINKKIPPLFWYAGAAFDIKPIVGLFNGLFPEDAQKFLSADIFPILTDYDSKIVEAIKYIYENFDKDDFSCASLPKNPWFSWQMSELGILQMIPLTKRLLSEGATKSDDEGHARSPSDKTC